MRLRHAALRIASALLLVATTDAALAQSNVYWLGADLVRLSTKVDDRTGNAPDVSGSAQVPTVRFRVGGRLRDWLDIESHLVVEREATYSTTSRANTAEAMVFALFLKPKLQLGRGAVYGLAGVSDTLLRLGGTKAARSYGNGDPQNRSDFAYGLGAQWTFSRHLSAAIEYTHYYSQRVEVTGSPGGLDVDLGAIGIGVSYSF